MIAHVVRRIAHPILVLLGIALLPEVAAAQRPAVRFDVSTATEAFSPDDWSTGMHRGSLFGGAWLGAFHLAGGASLWGSEFGRMAPGTALLLPVGVDTTFMLPVASGAAGAADSLEVVFPHFEEWEEGPAFPFDRADSADVALRATYALPRGDVGVSYRWARAQRMSRTLTQLYNTEGWLGRYGSDLELGLDGRLDVADLAGGTMALELDARRTRSVDRSGVPDAASMLEQQDGVLGFETASLGFLADEDVEYDDETLLAYRFDALPLDFLQLLPFRFDHARQTYDGIAESLRINPYGLRTGFPLTGLSTTGGFGFIEDEDTESRLSAALDWASAAGPRARVGADYATAHVDATRLALFNGRGYLRRNEPTRTGLFARAALARPQFAVSGGIRYDRVDPDGEYTRVPGFVSFLPDSLRRDFMLDDPATSELDLVPYEDVVGAPCNGAAACHDNFRAARVQDGLSLDIALTAYLPASSRAIIRVSDRMLAPLAPAGFAGAGLSTREWMGLLFANADLDFATGLAGTRNTFGRDVDMPHERVFQLRYALEAERFFLDAAIHSRSIRDVYDSRRVRYVDPVAGNDIYIMSLVNDDRDSERGFDVHAGYRFGPLSEISFAYTLVANPLAPLQVDSFASFTGPVVATAGVFDRGAWIDDGFGPAGNAALDDQREHRVRMAASLLTAPDRAGILADAALHAELTLASGLEYRRFVNGGDGLIGPSAPIDQFGYLAERDERETPWVTWLSLRAHKGFPVVGGRLRAFVEWSGPLTENQSRVFLETGDARNDEHREQVLGAAMGDFLLDGDSNIDDFWVRDCMEATPALCEVPPDNDLNAYALQRAEDRYGDGDGLFTVEEQRDAFDAWYQLFFGEETFVRADRSLRLGLEYRF